MRHGKSIAALLCAALIMSLCTGCGKGENQKDGQQEVQKGRWVETQTALPEDMADWTLQKLFLAGDEIHLLATKHENQNTVFGEWALKENGFTEVTQNWLSGIALPCGDWMELDMMQDESGRQYLYVGYVADGEEDFKGHLWTGDGAQAKDITPEKWAVQNEEWGTYEYPQGVTMLEGGKLFSISYLSMDLFSAEDGRLLESEPLSVQYGGSVTCDGETVYLCTQEGSDYRIEKRKGGSSGGAQSMDFPTDSSERGQICAKKDGTLISAGSDGIYLCQAGQEEWEKLIGGAETDFALTGTWCVSLAAAKDGAIYGLFRESGGGGKVNRYAYDPEAVIEVTENLKLYTVYESSLLQQAAVMYHKTHPEVLITIEYTYPAYYYDETDYNAVYQELNTKLMGEDAPDILVMDYLNMDSFIEKGLLADLGTAVDPLEESGQLVSRVTGSYVREDGSRYVVPLQFGFNMALGRDIAQEDMATLEALADFLQKADGTYLGPQTVDELVDKFYPYFCREIVRDKQLDKEALAGKLECLKQIAESCGMAEAREKGERCYNMWELASEAKLAFQEVTGFKDCMFPIAMVDYIHGSFTAYENSFLPSLQTGICTKSKHQETAMDFLRLALSESVQDTDYYKGFPVNLASLEKQAREDRSEAEAETSIEAEGGEVEFRIQCYSQETADRLLALCKSLDTPVKQDEKIREVLIESLGAYLDGSQTKEAAVQKIEDGLKMYLAE